MFLKRFRGRNGTVTQLSNTGTQNGKYARRLIVDIILDIVDIILDIVDRLERIRMLYFSLSFVCSATGTTRRHAILFKEPWEEYHELSVRVKQAASI